MVFKLGDEGVGYYRDDGPPACGAGAYGGGGQAPGRLVLALDVLVPGADDPQEHDRQRSLPRGDSEIAALAPRPPPALRERRVSNVE